MDKKRRETGLWLGFITLVLLLAAAGAADARPPRVHRTAEKAVREMIANARAVFVGTGWRVTVPAYPAVERQVKHALTVSSLRYKKIGNRKVPIINSEGYVAVLNEHAAYLIPRETRKVDPQGRMIYSLKIGTDDQAKGMFWSFVNSSMVNAGNIGEVNDRLDEFNRRVAAVEREQKRQAAEMARLRAEQARNRQDIETLKRARVVKPETRPATTKAEAPPAHRATTKPPAVKKPVVIKPVPRPTLLVRYPVVTDQSVALSGKATNAAIVHVRIGAYKKDATLTKGGGWSVLFTDVVPGTHRLSAVAYNRQHKPGEVWSHLIKVARPPGPTPPTTPTPKAPGTPGAGLQLGAITEPADKAVLAIGSNWVKGTAGSLEARVVEVKLNRKTIQKGPVAGAGTTGEWAFQATFRESGTFDLFVIERTADGIVVGRSRKITITVKEGGTQQ